MRPPPDLRRRVLAAALGVLVLGCAVAPPDTTPTAAPIAPGPTASASPWPTDTGGPALTPAPTSLPGPDATATPSLPPVAPSPSPSAVVPATIDPELATRLQAALDAEVERWPVPGASVVVRLASGERWTGVSGVASPRGDRITPDTVFAVASITKTFIAAAVLQLAEEGALSLDDSLADFVPGFERARRITLRQLLSHTSGIHDYFISGRYREEVFEDRRRRWTLDEILDLVLSPYCAPGRCFRYSNTNFVLLGAVIESATGNDVADELQRRIFRPLGLERTFFQPDQPIPDDRAHGHLSSPGGGFTDHTGNQPVIPHLSAVTVAWTAGAIASTPTDLATWAAALYGGQVLRPESLAQMVDFRLVPEYGLGTRSLWYLDRFAVGHLGGIRGFVSTMAYFPADGLTIVVTINRGMINPARLVKRVLRTLLD